jgi:osmoprotectant transport system ATP-binding protein
VTTISVRGASVRFGDRVALEPLDHDFTSGATTVLLGPSGCGKTTLLRALLGLVPLASGAVRMDGEVLDAASAQRLRRRIGTVFQDGGLFPHLSARRNVTLVADVLGLPREASRTRCETLRELARLPAEALERYPRALSGGQRQRVALMRALMLDPPVLLLDEPLGALDPLVRHDLQQDLKAIFASLRKTVVLVTHDLHEAAFLADEILLMRDGRVVQRGTLDDLLERPAEPFVTAFTGAQRADPRLAAP